MKVLFDTNVVLDLLLDRTSFADEAAALFSKIEQGEFPGYLCATTLTTVHYLLSKSLSNLDANTHIQTLASMFEIAAVNRLVIEHALVAGFSDFEDAVLYQAAYHAGAEYIVTRNISDFRKSDIPVYAPGEFISLLHTLEQGD